MYWWRDLGKRLVPLSFYIWGPSFKTNLFLLWGRPFKLPLPSLRPSFFCYTRNTSINLFYLTIYHYHPHSFVTMDHILVFPMSVCDVMCVCVCVGSHQVIASEALVFVGEYIYGEVRLIYSFPGRLHKILQLNTNPKRSNCKLLHRLQRSWLTPNNCIIELNAN